MKAVRAAAQDRGIAGLHAQAPGIGRHVGPAFIDDADDADGHAHPREIAGHWAASIPPSPAPTGSGKCRDVFQPLRHALRVALASSVSRSMKLALQILAPAHSRGRAGSRRRCRPPSARIFAAMARSASFFCAVGAQCQHRVRRCAPPGPASSSVSRLAWSLVHVALSAHQHHVVAMHQFIAAPEAQDLLDLAGLEARNARRIARIIGDQPARDLAAVVRSRYDTVSPRAKLPSTLLARRPAAGSCPCASAAAAPSSTTRRPIGCKRAGNPALA